MYKCNGMGVRPLTFRQMLSGLNGMAEAVVSPPCVKYLQFSKVILMKLN